MGNFAKAFSVHLLTATGAVLAMLALLAAADERWSTMFVWLVVAFLVDGIDGPLARAVNVGKYAPQWDGVTLDIMIDYLTYIFIPAYALFVSGLFPGWTGWISVGLIVFTSAIYMVDTRMKTEDKSFSGFPACWNMVVIVFFAFEPHWIMMTAIVCLLSGLQFVSVKFVHPVRTRRWRWLSLPAIVIWGLSAIGAAWYDFTNIPQLFLAGLLVTSLYLLSAGAAQQLMPERPANS